MPWIRAAGLTHRGLVRSSNEDCVALDSWMTQRDMAAPIGVETLLDGVFLCLVTDGMGGHQAGEVASLTAARAMEKQARQIADTVALEATLAETNKAIFSAMAENRALVGMGTTVAGVLLRDAEAFVFNVGDSRVYQQTGGDLRLLSVDDTLAGATISPRERTGLRSHALTQCLGGQSGFVPIEPHTRLVALTGGSEPADIHRLTRFLVCSDGLTDMLDQSGIEACLEGDPRASVASLANAALNAGGRDNLSIIVADWYP